MAFNFGDWMNKNVFRELKPVGSFFGSLANTGLNFMQNMSQNLLQISKGMGSMLSSPIILPAIMLFGAIFVGIRMKLI